MQQLRTDPHTTEPVTPAGHAGYSAPPVPLLATKEESATLSHELRTSLPEGVDIAAKSGQSGVELEAACSEEEERKGFWHTEKRIDPHDGQPYTFDEVFRYYKTQFSTDDVKSYWDKMKPVVAKETLQFEAAWNNHCACGSGRKYKVCCSTEEERQAKRDYWAPRREKTRLKKVAAYEARWAKHEARRGRGT